MFKQTVKLALWHIMALYGLYSRNICFAAILAAAQSRQPCGRCNSFLSQTRGDTSPPCLMNVMVDGPREAAFPTGIPPIYPDSSPVSAVEAVCSFSDRITVGTSFQKSPIPSMAAQRVGAREKNPANNLTQPCQSYGFILLENIKTNCTNLSIAS